MRELDLNETQAISGGSEIQQAILASVVLMTAGIGFAGLGLSMVFLGRLMMENELCDVCPTLNKTSSE